MVIRNINDIPLAVVEEDILVSMIIMGISIIKKAIEEAFLALGVFQAVNVSSLLFRKEIS